MMGNIIYAGGFALIMALSYWYDQHKKSAVRKCSWKISTTPGKVDRCECGTHVTANDAKIPQDNSPANDA